MSYISSATVEPDPSHIGTLEKMHLGEYIKKEM